MVAVAITALFFLIIKDGIKCSITKDKSSNNIIQVLAFEDIRGVNYSQPNISSAFRTDVVFDAKGMKDFYPIVNKFIDLLQPHDFPTDIISQSYKNDSLDFHLFIENLKANRPELTKKYLPFLVLIGVLVVLALLMPITGLFFWCCRCGGKCGVPSEKDGYKSRRRKGRCCRMTCGTVITLIVVGILFGGVCALLTNEFLEDGIDKMPETLNNSILDVSLYINNTKVELQTLLVDNYQELRSNIMKIMNGTGDAVKNRMMNASQAMVVDRLADIVVGLKNASVDLDKIKEHSEKLQRTSRQLQQGLNAVKNRLFLALNSCSAQECKQVAHSIVQHLAMHANYEQLPNVTGETEALSLILSQDVQDEVEQGRQSLSKFSADIQNQLDDGIVGKLNESINELGKMLHDAADRVGDAIDSVNLPAARDGVQFVNDANKAEYQKYRSYRYIASIGLASAELLIATLLTLGLMCVFCGRHSSYYEKESCTKATGSKFMIAAVYLTFLTSIVLLVTITLMMIVGSVVKRTACDPVTDIQQDSVLFKLVDSSISVSEIYKDAKDYNITVSTLISNCHKNESIYRVLGLKSIFNVGEINSYEKKLKINEQINTFSSQMNVHNKIVIIDPQTRKKLQKLEHVKLDKINFTKFLEIVDDQITAIDLNEAALALDSLASHLEHSNHQVSYELMHEGIMLRGFHTIASQMNNSLIILRQTIPVLQEHLKFNKSSFEEALTTTVRSMQDSQKWLDTKGNAEVQKFSREFSEELSDKVTGYLTYVVRRINHEIGYCAPVSLALNGTVNSVCKSVVQPWNMYWLSLLWGFGLCFIAIFFSVSFSKHYAHRKIYSGTLDYDGYPDRDSIPLANTHSDHSLLGAVPEAARSSYMGGDYSPADHSPVSSRRAYRHEAPPKGHVSKHKKHRGKKGNPRNDFTDWDLSNNRSRGYPNLTEYERPPPYYYYSGPLDGSKKY